MAKVILICGKICCGKSYYANNLKQQNTAVILSCDELTKVLFDNNLGDKHDEMSKRIWEYLLKKTEDVINADCNVILDWGFWSNDDRDYVGNYFKSRNINTEWHYINVDDLTWNKNIQERNQRILEGNGGSDFYLDEGLKNKLLSKWQQPSKNQIDVWIDLKR